MLFIKLKSIFKSNKINGTNEKEKNLENEKGRVSYFRKITYGLGGIPTAMISNAIAFYLSIFLLETAQISPFYLSIIQIIARAWDAITDPISGYLVSITNTRFGKFKPWIFSATPMLCIAFFLQFYSPAISDQIIKCIFYCMVSIGLQTGLTALYVPYSSMCMVLTSNIHERDQLNTIRIAFEMIGMLCGAGIFGQVALRNRVMNKESHNITAEMYADEKKNYIEASAVICGIVMFCIFCLLIGTKETERYKIKNDVSYLLSLKKIICFKPYFVLMFAYMFTSLGMQIIQFNVAIYVTHVLKLPGQVTFSIIVLLCSSLVLVPVGHKLMRMYGKKVIYFVGCCNMFPSLITLMLLPEHVNLWGYYAYIIWVSFSLMISMVLPWSMLPDVIDMFMLENESRTEAAFYSFFVFFNKFAVGIAIGISALALGFAGYDSKSKEQPKSVASMLRYFTTISGIICFIMTIIFLYFYPITERKQLEIALELKKRKNDNNNHSNIPVILPGVIIVDDKASV